MTSNLATCRFGVRVLLLCAVALLGAWGIISAVGLWSARRPPAGKQPDVFIYLVDAIRADHVGCYGYHRPTTPNLDVFASEAVLFEQAQATSSWTRPSVASIFTGLYAWTHGTRESTQGLADWTVPMPKLLAEEGYATAVFSGNPNITEDTGFGRGVDHFFYNDRTTTWPLNVEARRWLRSLPENQPAFVYIHAMDTHVPYAPSPESFALFDTGATSDVDGSVASLRGIAKRHHGLSEDDLRHLMDLYDGCLRDADAGFADFLAMLKRVERYENAIVIFLADHGEAFGEHETFQHGLILSEELLRVPMFVRYPGGRDAGLRVAQTVSLIDILPTLADEVGLDVEAIPYRLEGECLFGDSNGRTVLADVRAWDTGEDLTATIDAGGIHFIPNPTVSRAAPTVEMTDELRDSLRSLGYLD